MSEAMQIIADVASKVVEAELGKYYISSHYTVYNEGVGYGTKGIRITFNV